jgi:tryptophan synthase beta chain
MRSVPLPDRQGYFGEYGGRFVPETLINVLSELEEVYKAFKSDSSIKRELINLLSTYAGRPTPVYFAEHLSSQSEINLFLKREDLLHTGAHKLNNTLGQALLTRFMGKKRIIAETGAGQHGVATATVAALMKMDCTIYMGSIDMERQSPNVKRMRLLGAEVVRVEKGGKTLKDAINEALRDWVRNCRTTHYIIGSVVGPHPFPLIVRDFQSVIGHEARKQIVQLLGRNPDFGIACVGGGSNAAGFFSSFAESSTKLIGVEAGGTSLIPGQHSATLNEGSPGILHGSLSYLLQDGEGQVMPVHSVSAGLDYPAAGPEHSYWKDAGIVEYQTCNDTDAIHAFLTLSKTEGIIPALESSHALGYVLKNNERFRGLNVLINLSGRGDKDLDIIFKEAEL